MQKTIQRQREYFYSGKTLELDFRIEQLKQLKLAIKEYEPQLLEALNADLSKSGFEAYVTEIGNLYQDIDHTLKNLRRWSRPVRVTTPLLQFPASSKIYREPLGVVLIMSPWNYPLQLSIAPLIAVIAAGNCAVIKPSRYSSNTSSVIGKMISDFFPKEYISVFQGGSETNQGLLECRFDHIFFTGSPKVGRVVMAAAAKNLTPVTLELGGKSPCIVDETAKLKIAAKRIAWGKCVNAGQTCIAPDYLLVHKSIKDNLIFELKKAITEMYGDNPLINGDFPKIINQKHFERLCGLMESGEIVHGGKTDKISLKIEPTILDGVSLESPMMNEEIFGPLLPIITYSNASELYEIIARFESPLALYVFTENKALERDLVKRISYGGGCINDTIVHFATSSMPFGGVGFSGMGSYHGKSGFDTFSNLKSVMKRCTLIDIPIRYAPYSKKLSLIRKLMK